MLSFEKVFQALKSGNRVSRNSWDKGTFIHEQSGALIHVTRGIDASAMEYELGWYEMKADNWEILSTIA